MLDSAAATTARFVSGSSHTAKALAEVSGIGPFSIGLLLHTYQGATAAADLNPTAVIFFNGPRTLDRELLSILVFEACGSCGDLV